MHILYFAALFCVIHLDFSSAWWRRSPVPATLAPCTRCPAIPSTCMTVSTVTCRCCCPECTAYIPVCEQTPKVVGPCEAVVPSFSYNPECGVCEAFDYGGCDGNDNRFETKVECEQKCVEPCDQEPAVVGPCDAYFPSYTYNQESKQCEKFIYGGCDGNDNRFEMLDECEKCDPCKHQPSVVGPCDGYFPSYTYNPVSGECEWFVYGGCDGNDNRFTTKQDCEMMCIDPCEQEPAVVGPCEALIPSYTYNPKSGECEFFNYGGCDGNDNRYTSKVECEQACVEPCDQEPAVVGPCEAIVPSFTYNQTSGDCEAFDYGGCDGNDNRYSTLLECQGSCPPVCAEKHSVTGPCKALFIKFSYNQLLGKCVLFEYGGCPGTGNRFDTLAECQGTCINCNMVSCFIDPCLMATCAAHPNAVCIANYCNGCNYFFYENNVPVIC